MKMSRIEALSTLCLTPQRAKIEPIVAAPFLMTGSFHADIGTLAEVRNSFILGVLRIVTERLPSTTATFAVKHPLIVNMPSAVQKPRTLYDKVFQDHIVDERSDGTILLYIGG